MSLLLVTGGCGFIGSNFVRYLMETDPDVRVVNIDALTYAGHPANLADFAGHPRYRFIHADITDRDAVHVASVHQYDRAQRTFLPVPGAGGLPAAMSAQEGDYAFAWAKNIWSDMLGG